MALDLPKLRKLVALDENDPLSRFALGKKLFETHEADPSPATAPFLEEAATHLAFANAKDPAHLATYHLFGQALARRGRREEARHVYEAGITCVAGVGEGMGRDLGPAMQKLLGDL